jgi:hypothetical protein
VGCGTYRERKGDYQGRTNPVPILHVSFRKIMGSQRKSGAHATLHPNFTCASPILRLFAHCFASLRNVVLHADGESRMADPLTLPKRNLTFKNMAGRITLYLHGGFAPHYHSCSEGLCACTLPRCYFCIYLASGPSCKSI